MSLKMNVYCPAHQRACFCVSHISFHSHCHLPTNPHDNPIPDPLLVIPFPFLSVCQFFPQFDEPTANFSCISVISTVFWHRLWHEHPGPSVHQTFVTIFTGCPLGIVLPLNSVNHLVNSSHRPSPYLSELITHYLPSRAWRSSNTNLLARPSRITVLYLSGIFCFCIIHLELTDCTHPLSW